MKTPSFVSAMRLEDWPARDQQAWRSALSDDPLQPGGLGGASAWRPATREHVQRGYGVWLNWLRHKGRLDSDGAAAARATSANLREYLADMRWAGYSDFSCSTRLSALGAALRVMSPNVDTRFVSRAAGRVTAHATRVRDIPSRSRSASEVLELGRQLLVLAENEQLSPSMSAVLFRDGLLLMLLVYRPLRITNLAMIELDRHLLRSGTGFRLQFEAQEMKSHRAYGCHLPKLLIEPMERYLREFRAHLQGQGGAVESSRLWLGRYGSPLKQSGVTEVIRKRTKAAFGSALGPHILRHIVGTTLAEQSPENITEVAAVLGHQRLEISERHYIHASAIEAGGRLHEAFAARVAEHRKKCAGSKAR